MPMRQDCKFYESRSYPSGDTVRKCDLDLAPEAPWRCPENCPAFQRRLADVNWSHGSLVAPPTPPEPESLGNDDSIAALLDEAEEIVRNAGLAGVHDIEEGRSGRKRKQRKGQKSPKARPAGLKNKFGNLGQYLRDQRKKGR